MIKRLIINDIKEHKVISAATGIFMTVTAMLFGLSILLFTSLLTSIDDLMTRAGAPDFLQMHTGDISRVQLDAFVQKRDDVRQMQVCPFLNLPNNLLFIGDQSFDGNMQDNGLCCQSESFDFLLDLDGAVIRPEAGEVYVPVCYKKEYDIRPGDRMRIGAEELIVAGFLRDAQMNSMMASSKRFLVNRADYERLQPIGTEEYLIEFLLKDGCDVNAFATAYKDEEMPMNGPTITGPLIKMMNALSDGIMIMVILLLGVAILMISILCIRYILLTQLERDNREIGVLKAVGIPACDIRGYVLWKYLLLSAVGCVAGVAAAILLAVPIGEGMRQLYGESGNKALQYALMISGAALAEGMILLSMRRTLRGVEKESAVSVLRGADGPGKRRNLWVGALVMTAVVVFMMVIPQGIKDTLSSPDFVTYMGVGNSQIRIDIRQVQDDGQLAHTLKKQISSDRRVELFSDMRTGSYQIALSDGRVYNLMVENGDHGIFPVAYIEGGIPRNEKEIALSVLNAEEMGLHIGDTVRVFTDNGAGGREAIPCMVCGIYSDITNGGKTAKGCIQDKTPIMWSVFYVTLSEEDLMHDWIMEYRTAHATFGEEIKVMSITDYLHGLYGQTIRGVNRAAVITIVLSCIIMIVVVLLQIRLVIWRERNETSLKKALGLTSADIRRSYRMKALLYILSGITLGALTGVNPGQRLSGILLEILGAQGFRFVIDPVTTYVIIPALALASAGIAVRIALREIRGIRACECLQNTFE